MELLSLDDPGWSKLRHAYGPAFDTPKLLRALAAATPENDAPIWNELASSLLHQGDLYSATYAALPHLVAMLPGASLERQVDVLAFLSLPFLRAPDPTHDLGELAARVRPGMVEVVERAASSRTRAYATPTLIMLFVAVHAAAPRAFALPEDASEDLYGSCPSCERSVHFVVDGGAVFEVESLDRSIITPQRIVTPSRVSDRRAEGGGALAELDASWDDPFVFAVGAALAEHVGLERLADVLIALDTTIACARCGVAARLVDFDG